MKGIYLLAVIFSFLLFDVRGQGLGHQRPINRQRFPGRANNLAADKANAKLSPGAPVTQKATTHTEATATAGHTQAKADTAQTSGAVLPGPANSGGQNNRWSSATTQPNTRAVGPGSNGMFGMGPFGMIDTGMGDMFYPGMFRGPTMNNHNNNMGMNAWMRSQMSGIDLHPGMRKFICRGIKKPPKGAPVNPSLIYQHGLKAMMMAQSPMISKDINIGEGAAFCHGKEMEYRSCDKTPSRFRMPCRPNIPNSCNNPQMKCSVYNPDGYPQCCAKNFILANQLDRMW